MTSYFPSCPLGLLERSRARAYHLQIGSVHRSPPLIPSWTSLAYPPSTVFPRAFLLPSVDSEPFGGCWYDDLIPNPFPSDFLLDSPRIDSSSSVEGETEEPSEAVPFEMDTYDFEFEARVEREVQERLGLQGGLSAAQLQQASDQSQTRACGLKWSCNFQQNSDICRERVLCGPIIWIKHKNRIYYPIYKSYYVLCGANSRRLTCWLNSEAKGGHNNTFVYSLHQVLNYVFENYMPALTRENVTKKGSVCVWCLGGESWYEHKADALQQDIYSTSSGSKMRIVTQCIKLWQP